MIWSTSPSHANQLKSMCDDEFLSHVNEALSKPPSSPLPNIGPINALAKSFTDMIGSFGAVVVYLPKTSTYSMHRFIKLFIQMPHHSQIIFRIRVCISLPHSPWCRSLLALSVCRHGEGTADRRSRPRLSCFGAAIIRPRATIRSPSNRSPWRCCAQATSAFRARAVSDCNCSCLASQFP